MKKSFRLIIIFLMAFVAQVNAQDTESYEQYKQLASEALKNEQFELAAKKYQLAFAQFGGKAYPEDRYEAARAFAMSQQVDTAFYHLFRLANDSQYHDYEQLMNDKYMMPLHKNKQWKKLTKQVSENRQEYEKHLNPVLKNTLDSVLETDQMYRQQIQSIIDKYGQNSTEFNTLLSKMNETDAINTVKVTKILDEYGWLGKKVVGSGGNQALFLVIQHADIEIQDKYLPMMREAVKDGNALPQNLALLEDRVALRHGEKQLYGSQIHYNNETQKYYVAPIQDPQNVDKRRAEVGLLPLAEYVKYFDLEWDVDEHLKMIEEMEKEK